MSESITYLTNQFLIAMPSLANPFFSRTVTYICEHNASGALGIVINRPLTVTLGELLEHLQLSSADPEISAMPVYSGGPVHPEHGFIVHTPVGAWESTLQITETIGITTSQDVLQAIARGEGPSQVLVALGYAGWGPGQLEQELVQNSWLFGPADSTILFETPVDKRWSAAAALLGIDLRLLSGDAGHA